MRAAEKAANPKDRSRLRRKFDDLAALGERLKANAKSAATSARQPVPESTRTLTVAEKTLILKSSKLHGNIFPPWKRHQARMSLPLQRHPMDAIRMLRERCGMENMSCLTVPQ